MEYQIAVQPSEIHIKFRGAVTHEDIVDCCVEAAAYPFEQLPARACVDFSEGDCCACSLADFGLITSVARQLSMSGGRHSQVLVLPPCDSPSCRRLARLASDGDFEIGSRS